MSRKRFPGRCACFGFPPDENRNLFDLAPANPGTPGVFAFSEEETNETRLKRRRSPRPRRSLRLDGPGRRETG